MSNFANPELTNNFRNIILASNTATAPAVVFANDPTVGLYWDPDGIHLTGLADPINPSDVANKDYVDTHSGGGSSGFTKTGTSVALDSDVTDVTIANALNLTSLTLGAPLIPSLHASFAVGSDTFRWHNFWTAGDFHFATGGRMILDDTNVAYITGDALELSLHSGGNIRGVINGVETLWLSDTALNLENNALFVTPFFTSGGNGASGVGAGIFGDGSSLVGIAANNTELARFDTTAVAGNTSALLYDVDSGLLQRVSVGAPDSGGLGFKVLRIPN